MSFAIFCFLLADGQKLAVVKLAINNRSTKITDCKASAYAVAVIFFYKTVPSIYSSHLF